MNELFAVVNGEVKIDSRMIAEHFRKGHNDVLKDIRNEIEKLKQGGFSTEGIFSLSEYKDSTGRKLPCYTMTEEGALQLAARYDAVSRRKLILKIKELKENSAPQIDSQFLYQLASKLEEKEKQIAEMKPKALFADAVSASKSTILIGELAKVLKQNGVEIGQNRLFSTLRDQGYLGKRGEYYNIPTQKAMNLQLFEIKKRTINNPDGSIRTTTTTKVTGKGQQYFINKFLSEIKRWA